MPSRPIPVPETLLPRSTLSLPRTRTVAALAILVLAACSDGGTGPGQSRLTSGQAKVLDGGQGSERVFRIDVPDGTGHLRVEVGEGDGDPDLVVRFGAPPEPSSYDCASFGVATTEECLIESPQAGAWYVLLLGSEAYNDVRLVATAGGAITVTPLTTAVPVGGISGGAGSFRFYSITVPAGATHLNVQLTDGSGDADLFVRHASWPTYTAYDCVSWTTTSDEVCGHPSPAAGTWFVRIDGFAAYQGVTLRATVTMPP